MGCTPEALDVPRKVMAMNKAAMLQARTHTVQSDTCRFYQALHLLHAQQYRNYKYMDGI